MGLILDYVQGERPSAHERLMKVIRVVRRRWRLKMVIRGAAIVLGAGFAILLISAFGLDYFKFNPASVITFRIISYVLLLGLVVRFLLLPLSRRVTDQRIALYLEEHEPALESGLLSAIEFGGVAEGESIAGSAALVKRTVEAAIERCEQIDYGRGVERKALATSTGFLAGTSLAALAVILLAPPFLRLGSSFLLFPLSRDAVVSPYSISVFPGDARVARGGDLKIEAQLNNFDGNDIVVTNRWHRRVLKAADNRVGIGQVVVRAKWRCERNPVELDAAGKRIGARTEEIRGNGRADEVETRQARFCF